MYNYDPISQVPHVKPGPKRYYKLPQAPLVKAKKFWQNHLLNMFKKEVPFKPQPIDPSILSKIQFYNEAVRIFNLHPGYKAHSQEFKAYQQCRYSLLRLEQYDEHPAETAANNDRKRQIAIFLKHFAIANCGLNISKHKLNKLKAMDIRTAADVNRSIGILRETNGIGFKTFGPLFNWSQLLKKDFNYVPDQGFLAKEQIRLIKYIAKRRKFLKKAMDGHVVKIAQITKQLHTASQAFEQSHADFRKEFMKLL